MNISYLFKYLWKRKWFIIIPTILAIASAWLFSRDLPRSYTSMAELSTGYIDVNPLDNKNANNTVLFNNVIQTLSSNQVLDQLSYSLLLHDLQEAHPFKGTSEAPFAKKIIQSFPGGRSGLITFLHGKADSLYVLNLSLKKDRLVRELADIYGYSPSSIIDQTKIERIDGSDFINIITTTSDPSLSAFVANGICTAFLSYYQSQQGIASSSSLDTLRRIMETKKQLLDNKLKLLQNGEDYSAQNSLGMLSSLQNLLIQQKNNLIAAQVELADVSQHMNTAGTQGGLADNEDIIAIRNDIDNLYAKYVNSGSNDPSLLEQINKLRNNLQKKLSAVGNTVGGMSMGSLSKQKMDLEVKINVAKQTISDLQQKISTLSGEVQSSASREGLVQGVQNEIDLARQEYANANRLYNEAVNRDIFPGNSFKQTLIANPPLQANPSKKLPTIGLAGAGIFILLVFIFIFLEFLDSSIKTATYLKEAIPFPLLANLPYIKMKDMSLQSFFIADLDAEPYRRNFREQIKQVRYDVETSGCKIFLIASCHEGAGKTLLVEALAKSLSLNSKKVLMVDVNFKNNTLSRSNNCNKSCLETFSLTQGAKSPSSRLEDLVARTSDKNIQVLGCQSGSYTPDEILPPGNFFTYLKHQDSVYDYVLVDCAALNQGPDCKELLKYVDSLILLFSADQTLTEEDQKFVEFLQRNQIRIIGMVLNKVNSIYIS